jgi:hypothetical protein
MQSSMQYSSPAAVQGRAATYPRNQPELPRTDYSYKAASARGLNFVLYYSNLRTVSEPFEDLRSVSLYLLKTHWTEDDVRKHLSRLYELCVTFNSLSLLTVKRLRLLPFASSLVRFTFWMKTFNFGQFMYMPK